MHHAVRVNTGPPDPRSGDHTRPRPASRRKIHRQDRQVRADQLTQRRELRIPPGYPSPDRSPAVGHNLLLGPGTGNGNLGTPHPAEGRSLPQLDSTRVATGAASALSQVAAARAADGVAYAP